MKPPKGFSVVEVLIVVVFLAIVAALTLPRFSSGSSTARANTLAENLRVVRTQLEIFRGQHQGVPPGYPGCDTSKAPIEGAFAKQMIQASDEHGNTAAPGTPGFRFGLYLQEIPENPVNGKTTVQVIRDGAAFPNDADDSHGWIYKPETLTFKADAVGNDDEGRAYFEY